MDRRQFVSALGAVALNPLLARSSVAAPACSVTPGTGYRIVDASKDLRKSAKKLADAGVSTVIRFYTRLADFDRGRYQNTALSREELKALEDHGLAIASVYQYFSGGEGRYFHNPVKRPRDVRDAIKYADMMQQPEGSTIYFGADFDFAKGYGVEANESAIKSYFEHAQKEVSRTNRKVGIYGCGKACEVLKAEGWDMKYWLSASVSYLRTAEFYNSGDFHLFQTKTDLDTSFGEIDTNVLNPKFSDFGQWRTDRSAASESENVSKAVLDARKFISPRRLKIFSDPSRPRETLLNLDSNSRTHYGRSVRVLCSVGDAVGISLDESEKAVGFCKVADLQSSMPLW